MRTATSFTSLYADPLPPEQSPLVFLDRKPIAAGEVWIVRDDLLPGGTKQRAVGPYLTRKMAKGAEEFIYASPFSGFAQVALAASCQMLGVKAVLFCEIDPYCPDQGPHEFTRLAEKQGATIHLCKDLNEAERRAEAYADSHSSRFKLPLGFSDPQFIRDLQFELEKQLKQITLLLNGLPPRIWIPVGSGTLAQAFHQALKGRSVLKCVDVQVLPEGHPRFSQLSCLSHLQLSRAPQKFHQKASNLPPVPSNLYYDAKLWTFLENEGQNGDLWWNVAR